MNQTNRFILIVDDDELVLSVLQRLTSHALMPHAGTELVTASRAQEGLEIVRLQDRSDARWLIFSDRDMPAKDGDTLTNGLELTRASREQLGDRAHIVLMTGGVHDQEMPLLSLNGFLQKPFDMKDFQDLIQHFLEQD